MTDDIPALIERLRRRIDYRLNAYLCDMNEGHDDSIVGFNEAWDIVRATFKDEAEALSRLAVSPLPKEIAGLFDRIEISINPSVDEIVKRHTLSECRAAIERMARENERLSIIRPEVIRAEAAVRIRELEAELHETQLENKIMNQSKRGNCGTCHWFERLGTDGSGSCLVNPPTPVPMMEIVPGTQLRKEGPQQALNIKGMVPPTHESRRCEKWHPFGALPEKAINWKNPMEA